MRKAKAPVPRHALLFLPLFVALVAMLPRLWWAEFGLLDDGQTVRIANATSYDISTSVTMFREYGRFFPAYLLFLSGIYSVVGPRPVLFFAANYMVLCGITSGLMWLVLARGGTVLQATCAGLFFVLSAPAVESFYTLSKQDPPQLLWITASLVLLTLASRATSVFGRAVLFATITAVLLIANLAKETTVVLVPVSFGWLVVGWLSARFTKRDANVAERRQYFFANVMAWTAYVLLRVLVGRITLREGSYTQHYGPAVETFLSSTIDLIVLLARDFTYLVPLAVWLLIASSGRQGDRRLLLADSAIWMAGWIAVFLPWGRIFEYYLLPFTFGLAAFSGMTIGTIIEALRAEVAGSRRRWAIGCLTLFFLIWPLNLANHVTDAAVQLAVDSANGDMIRFAAMLPPGSVLLVDIPTPSEYNYEIGVHLADIHLRRDIVVGALDDVRIDSDLERVRDGFYVAVPELRRPLWPAVRIGVYEGGAVLGRGSREPGAGGDVGTVVYQTLRKAPVLAFGLHGLACDLMPVDGTRGLYCGHQQRLLEARVFSYGWTVYKVQTVGGRWRAFVRKR
jgi:hypothetical protein